MTPGTIYLDAGNRLWVVLSVAGARAAVAPVVRPGARVAGDVVVDATTAVRTAATTLSAPRGLVVGRVDEGTLARVVATAERAALTAQVCAKYSPLRSRLLDTTRMTCHTPTIDRCPSAHPSTGR